MSTGYYTLTLADLPSSIEDEVVGVCFEHGAQGTSEELSFEQKDVRYHPRIIPKDLINLVVYFSKPPERSLIDEIGALAPSTQLILKEEQVKDWLAEWKKGFHAFELCPSIWVVPSWERAPAAAKQWIQIEPGMAFGTGTHETTQLMALLMAKYFNPSVKSVLDVGTGSGILSILALILGAQRAVGTDIDVEALRVATENAAANNVSDRFQVSSAHLGEMEPSSFDWVLANIIDGTLIDLGEHLVLPLSPGGRLFLSGILIDRLQDFKVRFVQRQGLIIDEECIKGEWAALACHRKGFANQ